MSPAAVFAITAVCLQVSFALTFVAVSRAPGWPRPTLYVLLSLSAAAYSAVDILFALPSVPEAVLLAVTPLNYLHGAIHVSGWVMFAFSTHRRPWGDLPRGYRALVVGLIAAAVVVALPGVGVTGAIQHIDVPWAGSSYRQPAVTDVADLVGVVMLTVLALPYGAFLKRALRRERFAVVRVLGFTVFYVCAVDEQLVTAGVVEFLFLGDLGFLSMVGVLLYETIHRVIDDSRALAALREDLEAEVARRTRDLDAARDALVHADRLAVVGQLAAGVGHEINNPLTVIVQNVESLGATRRDAESAVLVGDTLEAAERIRMVVADLRAYARPEPEQRVAVDLDGVVRASVKVAAHALRHVDLRELHGARVAVDVDPLRLSQVFVNLLVNAGQALMGAESGHRIVTVSTRAVGADALVEIRDTGPGMDEATLARLGEPYFTTRANEGGTGLGLFVSRGIVDALGGRLVFESRRGEGTVARVILPVAARSPIVEDRTPTPAALAATARRWLVIDDDAYVGRAIERALAPDDVVRVGGGREALDRIEAGEVFDVVLCDVVMPGLSGIDVYEAIAATRPALLRRFVFMTGGALEASSAAFLAKSPARCLFKPFTKGQLAEVITSLDA